jgi:transcriptional regulator with XRE-family HTH domain
MAALPICQSVRKATRAARKGYPRVVESLGDHLRARRMDVGLTQRQVASRLAVTQETVLNWELNRTRPGAKVMPRISEFLGGFRRHSGEDLPSRLRAVREHLGVTQVGLAELLGVNPSTILRWEHGRGRPPSNLDVILNDLP